MIKNKGIIFGLIFIMLAFLTYDIYARGRRGGGGGGRHMSKSSHARGGSFSGRSHHRSSGSRNISRSGSGSRNLSRSGSGNRNLSKSGTKSGTNRKADASNVQNNRKNNAKDLQDNRKNNASDLQEDRQNWKDDNREDWQDYGDNARGERQEFVEHNYNNEWNEWGDHYENWEAGGVVAGLVIGATLSAVAFSSAYPSGGCITSDYGGVIYYECGGTYYQKVYRGGDVTYIVVEAP